MRVVVVMPGVGPEGGAEQSLLALAPPLLERGITIHLALLSSYQDLVPTLERLGVIVHDLSGAASLAGQVRRLRALTRAVRPHVVHATLWQATFVAQLASIGPGPPLLVTWAVTPSTDPGSAEHASGRWKRVVLEMVDAVLGRLSGARYHAVTDGVATAMGTRLRVPPERVRVAERGRDLDRFRNTRSRAECRERLGLPTDSRVVLAVGRQDPQKGYPTLLRAFDQLASTHDDARLVIAGRAGAASSEIDRIARSLDAGDRVVLLGHRDDLEVLYGAADVMVCASWREGAAGALIEAMAAGVPIVSVRLDGLDGVLVDGVNARVCDRSDLAQAMAAVLDDPDTGSRLAQRARRLVEERFSVDRAAAAMLDTYRWARDPR